jgi:hypothetical protein
MEREARVRAHGGEPVGAAEVLSGRAAPAPLPARAAWESERL